MNICKLTAECSDLINDRLAPEYLLQKTDYTSNCDIYSFGKPTPKAKIK